MEKHDCVDFYHDAALLAEIAKERMEYFLKGGN